RPHTSPPALFPYTTLFRSLIAIGLAITFGVMGVINMAHGELMMLGAYTTYVVQTAMPGHIGISILVAIPAAFAVAALAGVLIERDRKSTRLNSSHVAISYA